MQTRRNWDWQLAQWHAAPPPTASSPASDPLQNNRTGTGHAPNRRGPVIDRKPDFGMIPDVQ